MASSVSSTTLQTLRNDTTSSRHRRSTISLHSKPGLGLIRTISRDLITGWHTTTALQKEPSYTSTSSSPPARSFKPRHAARDAMKSCPLIHPTTSTNHQEASNTDPESSFSSFENAQAREMDPRPRQDSLTPSSPKPLACVDAGLIPDHSFDTWTAIWDTAYEARVEACHTYHPPSTPGLTRSHTAPVLNHKKRTRFPLAGRLAVTDADIKKFVFGDAKDRKRGYQGPEDFLTPSRRGSEVPSLVRSEGSCESGGLEDLEELEEGEERSESEVEVEIGMNVHVNEKRKGRADGIQLDGGPADAGSNA
ncbi:hypothetical protein E4T39_01134 [Aureobasidium subglaciale]|nr:hypothetical protein E4T39_01134 [Aureobasidium subglaciale]